MNLRNKRAVLVLILGAGYGVFFFVLNVFKLRSFFSFEWADDAAENQVIYNIAAFFNPHQTVFLGKYFFGHFTPVYFLIAVFYRIFPSIFTLYFIISFLYGLCAFIVYMLAREFLDENQAFFTALIYLLFAPLHYVNLGTLDGNIFALPLLFTAWYFIFKKKFLPYAVFMALSCLCKEDIPLGVFLLGIYLLIKKYPKKWWLTTCLFSLLYFIFAMIMLPQFRLEHHLAASAKTQYFRYLDISTFREIFKFIFSGAFINALFDFSKLKAFSVFLYPLLFLPLLTWEFYLALPFLLEIILHPSFSNDTSYYFSPVIPFAFVGFIFALKRLNARILIPAVFCLAVISNLAPNFLGPLPKDAQKESISDPGFLKVNNIFDSKIYTLSQDNKPAWDIIKMLPDNASVTASGDLLPALSSRKNLYEFGLNVGGGAGAFYARGYSYPAYSADYIFIHKKNLANGFGGKYVYLGEDLIAKEVKKLIERDYKVMRQERDFILMRKINAES
ncbi:MAG: DUF2079 domain-containing protein [Candidatus Omnitrophica bacterium]|nr:DUF2079 domain-containing protein [Candidatus Omnitrophota bacterium]